MCTSAMNKNPGWEKTKKSRLEWYILYFWRNKYSIQKIQVQIVLIHPIFLTVLFIQLRFYFSIQKLFVEVCSTNRQIIEQLLWSILYSKTLRLPNTHTSNLNFRKLHQENLSITYICSFFLSLIMRFSYHSCI